MLERINWRKAAFVADGAFFLILALGFALHLPLMAELWLYLHHHRYDRPRDVVAVCRSHHTAAHRGAVELKPGGHRKWARAPDTSVRCH
jgi:hypothetical protein